MIAKSLSVLMIVWPSLFSLGNEPQCDVLSLQEVGSRLKSPVQHKMGPNSFAVTSIQENIVVMSYTGDIQDFEVSPEHPIDFAPRQEMMRAFYEQVGDVYDLVAFTSDFGYIRNGSLGFHVQLKNDITGIGMPLIDHSADFHSSGKLQGLIELGAATKYLREGSLTLDQFQALMLHEIGHRWLARVSYLANGQVSPNLQTADGGHWSFLLDSDASHMYGHDWQAVGDGTWTVADIRNRYSDLDLYLMGFLPAQEVAPLTLLHSNEIPDNSNRFPTSNATISATAETVEISQIIAAEGPRAPAFVSEARTLRIAFVFLHGGAVPASTTLTEFNRGLAGLDNRFQRQTKGLGHLDFRPSPYVSNESPVDVTNGLNYLALNQVGDAWADTEATKIRDSVEVIRALVEYDRPFEAALSALTSHTDRNLDDVARITALLGELNRSDDGRLQVLRDARRADGGYALRQGRQSNALDTALALQAFVSHSEVDHRTEIEAALAYLMATARVDGSWGQGDGTAFETAVVLEALQRQSLVEGTEIDLARARATTWLLGYQGSHGGVGQTDVDYVVTSHLQRALGLTGTFNPLARTFLEQGQAANGSWSNRVHTTALVLTTLKQLENLQVADVGLSRDAVTFFPAAPVTNQPFLVTADITNYGNAPAEDVTLTLFLNDPDEGGVAQVSRTFPKPLLAGESRQAQVTWDVPGGLTQYSVVLEVSTSSGDASPANDRITYDFTTDIPGPDPLIESDRVQFTSNTPLVGENLQIRVPVLNAGGEPATGLSLSLFDGDPNNGQIIGGPVSLPDLASFGRFEHIFDWLVPAPTGVRTLFLVLESDLDLRPENNSYRHQIQVSDIINGVDLGINPLSVMLTPETYEAAPQIFSVSFDVLSHGVTSPAGLNAHWYRGPPESGGVLLASTSVPISSNPTPVTLSATFDYLGDFDLFLMVEPQGGETDERPANNRHVLRLDGLSLEDLEVVPNSLSADPLLAGQDVQLQAVIHNRNLLPRTGIIASFFVDTGTGFQLVGRDTIGLPGAGSATTSVTWRAPDTPVTGTIRVMVDPDLAIAEVEETDNEDTLPFETQSDTLANLTLADDAISFSPPPHHEGERLDIQVVVANTGGSAAAGTLTLFLNNEASGPLVPTASFPELAPGEQTTVSFTLDPVRFRGDQLIMAQVETPAQESNTGDNVAFRSIYVVGGPNPTFGPTPISLNPSWPAEGELVTVTVNLENRGALTANGLVVDLRSSDAPEDLIERRVIELPPGQQNVTFQITAQADLQSLVCLLDPDNQIIEQVETDNRAVLGIVLRDGEMALDEPIFSPNDDGVKDQVTLFWARPESRLDLNLTNGIGDLVRKWTDLPGSGSLVWNGQNEAGEVLGDGFYTFQLIDPESGFALRDQTVAIDTNRGTIADSLATSDPGFYSISDPEKELGFGWFGWAKDASSLLADSGSSGPALYVAPDGSHSQTLGDPFAWAVGGTSIAGFPGQWLVRTFDGLFTHFRNGEEVRSIYLGFDDALEAWIRPEIALVWNFSSLNLVDLRDGTQTPLEIPGRSWGNFVDAFLHNDVIYVLESDTSVFPATGRILTWDWEGGNFAVFREYENTELALIQRQGRYFAMQVTPASAAEDLIFFDLDQGREVRWSELYPGTVADGTRVFDDARLHRAPIETGTSAFGVVGDWVTGRRFVVTDSSLELLREKISPDGTTVAASAFSSFGQAIYTTRHNLGLNFEAFLTGVGAVQVQGSATDRHLQDWRLDYAMPSQPDQWFPTGIQGNFQVLDAFMGIWVPENPGNYLLRLTARDKAGNEKSRKTVVEVIETLPFYSLVREPFFFSPNNDGVQDEVTLRFTVRDPFEANLIVTNESGLPVRNMTRFYGSPGPGSLTWDGLDDSGNLAPDGLYRLGFNGLSYSVILDNTAPQVQFDFVESLRRSVRNGDESMQTVVSCYEMLVHDPHIRSWRLERRPLGEQDWVLIRSDSGNYQTSPYDDFPDYLLTVRQVLGHEFRLVAEDIAGNSVTLSRAPNIPAQVWTMAGRSQPTFLEDTDRPLTTLAYGGIELLKFEAVIPQDRFPLTLTALEYGSTVSLANPTLVPSPQAEQKVFDGPFFEPGLFDRNLPAEDSIYFRLVLTDTLGTVYRTEVINRLNVRFQVELISLAQRDSGDYRVGYRITSDARTDQITGTLLGLQERDGRFARPVGFGGLWEPGEECIQTVITETTTVWPNDEPPSPGNEFGRWNRFILDDVILFAGSPNQVRLGRFVSQQFCSFRVTLEAVGSCREPDAPRSFDVYFPFQVLDGGTLQFFADEAGQVPISISKTLRNGLDSIALDDALFNGEGWFPIFASLKDQAGRNIIFDQAGSGDRIGFTLIDRGDSGDLIQPAGAIFVTTEPIEPVVGDQVICAPSALEIAAWNSDQIPIPRIIEFQSGRATEFKPLEGTRAQLKASPLFRLWAQPVGLTEPRVPLGITNETQAEINLGRLLGYDAWEIHLQAINESGYCDEGVGILTFSDFGGGLNGDFRILEDHASTRTIFSPVHDVNDAANVHIQVTLTAGFAAWIETTSEPVEVISVLRGGGSLPVGFHDLEWNGRNDEGSLVADGTYRLVIVSYAACGASHEESIRVTLDTQPPVAQINKPLAGPVRLPAPVQVTATDENYLEEVVLTVFPTADPNARTIHFQDGRPPNLVEAVLPALSLEPGDFTLQWLVEDRAGNQTLVTREIEVARHLTLEAFELTENWISPNADGVQEGTVIRYGLGAPAPVTLEIRQREPGVESWLLLDSQPTPAGIHERFFDAVIDASVTLEDGAYDVVITVQGAEGDEIATQELYIDRVAPSIAPFLPEIGGVYDQQAMPVEADISDNSGRVTSWRLEHESQSVIRYTLAEGFDALVGGTLAEISNPEAGRNTLYLQATDPAGNRADLTIPFVRDPFAPVVTLISPQDNALIAADELLINGSFVEDYPESMVFTLVNEDDETELGVLAAKDLTGATFSISLPIDQMADGRYTLRATMIDRPGHRGEDTVAFILDRLPPVVALNPLPNGGLLTGPTSIFGSVTDPSLERWELAIAPAQGGPFIPIVSDNREPDQALLYLWSILPADGDWQLRLSATDGGGRTSEIIENLTIDTTPPGAPTPLTLVPVQYGEAPMRFSRVTLNWTPVADPGLAGYWVYRNGIKLVDSLLTSTSYIDDPVDDGDWLYQVRAVDLAGNLGEFADAPVITLDTVAPQPLITQPRSGDTIGGLVSITGSITDPRLADWTLEFNDPAAPGIWTLLTTSSEPVSFGELYQWLVSGLQPGDYHIRLRARDTFGNVGEALVAVVVETEAPAKPATPMVSETSNGLSVTWVANAEPDIAHYRVYRNDSFVGTDSPENPLEFVEELPDGVYSYRIIAVDSAGNRSPISDASPPYTLDLRDPHVVWITPVDGTRFDTSIQLEVFSADTDILSVLFQYQPTGGSVWTDIANDGETPWSVLWEPMGLPEGDYRLRAVAMERDSGDVDPNPDVITVGYGDAVPPGVPQIESHLARGAAVTLSWRAVADSDLAGYRVFRDNQLVGETDALTTTLTDPNGALGTQTYTVVAFDNVGNVSEPSDGLEVRIFMPLLDQDLVWADSGFATFSGSGDTEYTQVEARLGNDVLGTTTVDSLGRFSLQVTPTLSGFSDLEIVQTHPDGHISLGASATALLAGLPAVVTDLQGAGDGGTPENVDLTWTEPVPAVAGYLIRADGDVRQESGTAEIDTAIASSNLGSDHRMIDGNVNSFWVSFSSDRTRKVTLTLAEPHAVTGLRIQWYTFYGTPSLVAVEARLAGRLVPIWSFPGNLADEMNTLDLGLTDRTVVTDELVLTFTHTSRVGIREIEVLTQELLAPGSVAYTDLDPGQGLHAYEVLSMSPFGRTAAAGPVLVGIGDYEAPEPPTNLSAVVDGSNVTLTWTASVSSDVSAYRIYRDGRILATVPDLTHLDLDLHRGQYQYQVTAIDSSGNESDPSAPAEATVEAGIEPPVLSGFVDGTTVRLQWDYAENPQFQTFRVFRQQGGSGSFELVSDPAREPWSETEWQDGGPLSAASTYAYRVAAVDQQGRENFSNTIALAVPVPVPNIYFPGSVGASVTLFEPNSILTGFAEPGARLGIYKDNQAWGELETQTNTVVFSDILSSREPLGLAVSPDGNWLVHTNRTFRQLTLKNLVTQDRSNIWIGDRAADPAFDPSSQWLAYVDRAEGAETGMLEIMRLETQEQMSPFPAGSVYGPLVWKNNGNLVFSSGSEVFEYDPRRDETQVLYRSTEQVTLLTADSNSDRVILREIDGLGVTRISSVANQADQKIWLETDAAYEFAWSPALRQLTAADMDGFVSYLLVDLDHLPVVSRLDAKGRLSDYADLVGVSADGLTLVCQQTSGALALWNIAAEQPIYLGILGENEQAWAPIWSPWGELLAAYREGSQFEVNRFQLPGFFRTRVEGLEVGPNYFTFDALEPMSQTRSERTESLLLNYSLEMLPDLQVSEDDLRIFPAIIVPGDAPVVQVNVRNLGGSDAENVVLRWKLTAPDQSMIEPFEDQVVSVPAGALATAGFSLDSQALIPGTYTLEVGVDPDGLIGESDEDNNTASRVFIFSIDDGVLLDVVLANNIIPPLGDLNLQAEVTNLGSSLSDVRVMPRVESLSGTILAELTPWDIPKLGVSSQEQFTWDWSTVTLLAGDYRLVTPLTAANEVLAERTLDFSVQGDPSADLSLSGLPDQINVPDAVTPQASLTNTSSNVAFSQLTWRAELRDSSNGVIGLLEGNLPTLLPGADHLFHFNFETTSLLPGDYVVALQIFEDGTELTQTQEPFVLISQPIFDAGISLYVTPFDMQAGDGDVAAEGVISNIGNRNLALELVLTWLDEDGAPLADHPETFTLLPGETGSLETRFSTQDLPAGTYTVRMHNDDQMDAELRISESVNVNITSNRVPEIVITGIPESGHAGEPVTLLIEVLDDENPLPEANVLLNGQPYVSGTPITEEGFYTVTATVTDSGGSQASASERFDIDLSPPVISVLNIDDGDVINGTVVPEILIEDLNIVVRKVTLNDELYIDGQLISAPGTYHLHIEATDILGNNAQFDVRFTLAESLPLIELTGVSDGEQYREARTVGVNLLNGSQLESFQINGVDQTAPFQLTTEGATAISARASLNGNTQDVIAVVILDFTPPLILIQGVTHQAHYNDSVQPMVLVDGQPTSEGVLLDGSPFISGSKITDEGMHQLHVQALDAAGNMSVADVQFTLDYTAPELSVFGVEDGGVYTESRMISWVASDNWLAGVSATLNDASVSSPLNVSDPGEYVLRLSARDQAGNSVSRQIAFTLVTGYELVLNANPETGGTVSGAGTWPEGTLAVILAVPADGYRFDGWSGAGVTDPLLLETTVAMTESRQVTANFVRTWNLTVVADPPEGGTVAGAGLFDEGEMAPISAVPAAGYRFNGWQGEGVADPQVLETTVLMTAERTAIAMFGLNAAPMVANPIADQVIPAEAYYEFVVPEDTFVDADPGDTLSYEMTLADDSSLPVWLTFDPISRELSGTPELTDVGVLTLKVTARDELGLSAVDEFLLTVEAANLGEIRGMVFEDFNSNGRLEVGEPGLNGRTQFLDLNRNGMLDADEPSELSDMQGDYAFTGVAAGTYVLRTIAPEGWRTTVDLDALFGRTQLLPAGVQPIEMISGDLNGDDFPELVFVSEQELRIHSSGADGVLFPWASLAEGSRFRSAAVADFNGDGFGDIASVEPGTDSVSLFINRGDGSFDPAVGLPVESMPVKILAIDLDQDDYMDLVVANNGSESLSVIYNRKGTFLPAQSLEVSSQMVHLTGADLTGDGYPDLFVTGSEGQLWALSSQKGADFGEPALVQTQAGPHAPVFGDWNGDGALDLAIVNRTFDSIILMENNRKSAASDAVSLSIKGILTELGATDPGKNLVAGLVASDIDLDGDSDLLATIGQAQNVAFIENRGGHFAPLREFPTSEAPGLLTLLDLSGDGDVDPVFLTGTENMGIVGMTNDRIRTVALQPGEIRENMNFGSVRIAPVQVESPNGGEQFTLCEMVTIRWSAAGLQGTVDIELSRDGGKTWELLFAGLENDGSEKWRASGEATASAFIRVSVNSQTTYSDVSDAAFELVEGATEPTTQDAIDAATHLIIRSNALVDSYDARLGPYGGTNMGQAGHVRSGGTIDIQANAQVFGDLRIGSPSGATPEPVPAGLVSQGNLTLNNNQTLNLEPGDYLFDAILLKNRSVLQTNGAVRIWFSNLTLNNSARIEPQGLLPGNMRLYGLVNDGEVDLKAQSTVYGFLYSPAGDVIVRSQAVVYGAITGRQVTVNAQAQIHRDVALGQGHADCSDPIDIPATPIVDRAVIAVSGDITVRENGRTDSFNSCLGPYSDGNQSNNGHLQAAGEIHLAFVTWVSGHLHPNTPMNASTVPIPAGMVPGGDLVIPSGTTVSLAAGNYLVHNLTLGSHSRLIGKDGPVRIWYTGSLVVNNGAVLESETGEPTALMLYGQDGGTTEIKAEGKVAGLIYSPSQPFTLHSQGRLYGAVVSAQAEIKSNGQVHFDEALADGCAPSQSGDPPERGASGKATPSDSGRQ